MTAPTSRRRIAIADLPDIAIPVAVHGTLTRGEVGGSYCFAIVVAVAHGDQRQA